MAATRVDVEVEGRRLSLSNLDKVMYPEVGFTKGQLIDYYTRVAPALLPHLRDRPLTLKRYPNGVEGQYFYEKRCPSHAPDWVRSEEASGINFCVCDDLATLVWLANLADLELHPSLSLVDDILRPTVMAFDLDPGPPAGLAECCEVALILREALLVAEDVHAGYGPVTVLRGVTVVAREGELGADGHGGDRAIEHGVGRGRGRAGRCRPRRARRPRSSSSGRAGWRARARRRPRP